MSITTAWTQDEGLEDINFPLNSSVVVDGFQGLELLAAVMSKHENLDLEVTGFTDSLGTPSYNKGLSERRAQSVKAYLVGKGVAASAVNTNGEGITRAHDNATREGRFQNRSVRLTLFETISGMRSKVSYPRLLELFFGGPGGVGMQALKELKEETTKDNSEVLARISDLKDQLNAMNDALQRRIGNLEKAHAELAAKSEELPKRAQLAFNLGKYSGVSISAGGDDDGFTAQVRGLYFKTVSDHFAVQAQGDASYYDTREEGQADLAAVFQNRGFKLTAAGSYKWASIDGLEAIRVAQGALIADWRFDSGKIGLFGTFPIADGDVIGSQTSGAYTWEQFVTVPTQLGFDFGVSIGDKIDFSGFASSLDTEVAEADLAAGLTLQMLLKDHLSWYLDAQMNDGLLDNNDDNFRYQLGVKLGSWNQARYNVSDQITPVNIPRVRYEIQTRLRRTGNTAPIADAGQSRTNVAAGTVNLDGSNSSDPESDALTYRWTQTNGPAVELSSQDTATTSFEGVAGYTYTFQLTVRDSQGATGTDSVTIAMEAAPIPDPVVNVFVALPDTIDLGQTATLSWVTENGDDITLSGIGTVPPSGQVLVSPDTTTEYTLTVTNGAGSTNATATITVVQPPPTPDPVIDFFSASPDTIDEGEFVTLSWSTRYAETVTITGLGQVNASGSLILSPTETTDYTLTAESSVGSDQTTITVTVNPIIIPPPNHEPVADAGIDFQLNSGQMGILDGSGSFDPDGDTLTYSWTQIGGPSVALSGADTAQPSFIAGQPGEVYTFRLLVDDGRGGVSTDTVNVFVLSFKR